MSELAATPGTDLSARPLPAAGKSGGIVQQIKNFIAQPAVAKSLPLVGFVGMSEFDATVIFSDAASGEELGRLKVNRNSWPLPIGSASNVVQSVDFHMHAAAKRVAAELAKAKGIIVPEPEKVE